jgi:hypothetical protein
MLNHFLKIKLRKRRINNLFNLKETISVIKTEQDLRKYIEQVISDQEYEINRRDADIVVYTYHEKFEEQYSKPVKAAGSGSVNPQKLVYYFNDEAKPVTVVTGTLEGARVSLSPVTGDWFSIYCKKKDSLFIKKWPSGLILISSTEMTYDLN